MGVLAKTIIVGLGKTGYSCVEYFLKRGESIAVVDHQASPALLEQLIAQYPQVPFLPVDQASAWLSHAERIVVSPGVDAGPLHASIDHADEKEWVGDIALFCQEAQAPIIAITGSNGKTTVATVMGEVIEAAGLRVEVCGNIGEPVLNALSRPVPDYYVLELSSFQLEWVDHLAADVAVILNAEPDHMDRYASFEDYVCAKQRIYADCQYAIVNHDQPDCWRSIQFSGEVVDFSVEPDTVATYSLVQNEDEGELFISSCGEERIGVSEMPLQGEHHWKNAMVVLAIADALQLPSQAALSVLRCFKGLAHRCELVAVREGVSWINDSKATNVAATVAAIHSLSMYCDGRLVLIMGGDGKGADFSLLQPVISQCVSQVILIGRDAGAIASAIGDDGLVKHADNLSDAVGMASAFVRAGDTVALSPACASFDMFDNYQDRGQAFIQCVSELG